MSIPISRREVMYMEESLDDPLEVPIGSSVCWVQRENSDEALDVLDLVFSDLRRIGYLDSDEDPVFLKAEPILMRVESEVEAKIAGHEDPCYVSCTGRARHPEPFWRVWRSV